MKDLKDLLKTAVDKIKSTVEKEDIPLKEAFEQMDRELEEAEKAYGKPLFPEDDEQISINEHYLKILGFKKDDVSFDEIKSHYEILMRKFNPENFAQDEAKKQIAQKRIEKIEKAYRYFEEEYNKNNED